MTAERQDFSLYQGDHRILYYTIVDATTGDAEDLTDATIRWVAYDETNTILIDKSTGAGNIVITDASGGIFQVFLVPGDTEEITPRLYTHEVEITDSANNISTAAVGMLTIKRSNA